MQTIIRCDLFAEYSTLLYLFDELVLREGFLEIFFLFFSLHLLRGKY